MVLLFSATESDNWSRELLATLAGDLGFDPWESASELGPLDLFGPYQGEKDGQPLEVHIAFTGLASTGGIEPQQAIGQAAMDWVGELDVQLAWLDGDQAQLQIGQTLVKELPIMFTGVVLNSSLFYEVSQKYTGFYKRHSMSAVFGEVWKIDPEAKKYALFTDSSSESTMRVKRFVDIQFALPTGQSFFVSRQIESWDGLASELSALDDSIDAIIVCGMGQDGSAEALRNKPCPPDILEGVGLPVVTLGPTRLDSAGVMSVRIDPAIHARLALAQALDILGGTDPRVFMPTTPETMARFRSEIETEPDSESEGETDSDSGDDLDG